MPPMTNAQSRVRRSFLQFLLSVAAVHVVAITGYYLFDVAQAAAWTQRVFGWTWMGATIAVIVIGLQRIKRARRAARIRPAQ
jgi:hypothetical protein